MICKIHSLKNYKITHNKIHSFKNNKLKYNKMEFMMIKIGTWMNKKKMRDINNK